MRWRPRQAARARSDTVLVVLVALACAAAACSVPPRSVGASSRSAARARTVAPGRRGTLSSRGTRRSRGAPLTSTTITPPPLRTTTTAAPPLPAPGPLTPLVSPPLPGEGQWSPAGDRLAGGYGIYTTTLRPASGYPPAGVAWIDSSATRVALYAGTGEPSGSWPEQGSVAPPEQPSLLAAFNAGFRIYAYGTGWYEQGRTAEPLSQGAASFVVLANGTATVADWGRDIALGPNVAAVRQNLTLLVDHGAPTPDVTSYGHWGAVLGGGVSTWRSGVGVTAAGDLVYVGGPDLGPSFLANLLVAAGSVRAMELDINPEWVSFASFTHAGGYGGAAPAGTNLLSAMSGDPARYLQGYSRDFFAVFGR